MFLCVYDVSVLACVCVCVSTCVYDRVPLFREIDYENSGTINEEELTEYIRGKERDRKRGAAGGGDRERPGEAQ